MKSKTPDLQEALEKLRQLMIEDSKNSVELHTFDVDVAFEHKENYVKVIKKVNGMDIDCAAFVVASENDEKFHYGSLLKPLTKEKPSASFSRGNVFNLDKKKVSWAGF